MQLFYVDRLVHYKRHVAHDFPLLKGWMSDVIHVWYRDELDKIEFGRGFVDSRFEPAQRFRTNWDHLVRDKEMFALEGGEGSSSGSAKEPATYKLSLLTLTTAKKVVDSMSTLMALIVDATLHIRENLAFSNVVQTNSALIGIIFKAEDTTADGATST